MVEEILLNTKIINIIVFKNLKIFKLYLCTSREIYFSKHQLHVKYYRRTIYFISILRQNVIRMICIHNKLICVKINGISLILLNNACIRIGVI